MLIIRKSPITEEINTLEIDVTEEQLQNWKNGMLIQDAMPDLSADDREFIVTGCTPEDWTSIFEGDE